MAHQFRVVTVYLFTALLICTAIEADDDAQAQRDETIVEAVLRLDNYDVNANPTVKAAVSRYLARKKGTERYLELVERFKLRDAADELLRMALEKPDDTLGVQAAGLLLKLDLAKLFSTAIRNDKTAVGAVSVLGSLGNSPALELLKPVVTDGKQSLAVRSAAAKGLGRNRNGQRFLLEKVIAKKLNADLKFTVANILHASPDPQVRAQAAKLLVLPVTADARPLPPLAELVKQKGSAERGKALFIGKATCAKCHKVFGEGKEVGPDLSEIGSKLARDAMFVSILDPSAGISHNYGSFTVYLLDGQIVAGIPVSETDDSVTIRTAEAIDRKLSKDEIEEMVKDKLSLMPDDVQKMLTIQELVDLVEYLKTLTKK